jgi:hypothetical protein
MSIQMITNEPIEQACLRSVKICRVLRRQMTASELLRAYDIECSERRRRAVLMMLTLQHWRLVKAARLARIERVGSKPRRIPKKRSVYGVK